MFVVVFVSVFVFVIVCMCCLWCVVLCCVVVRCFRFELVCCGVALVCVDLG